MRKCRQNWSCGKQSVQLQRRSRFWASKGGLEGNAFGISSLAGYRKPLIRPTRNMVSLVSAVTEMMRLWDQLIHSSRLEVSMATGKMWLLAMSYWPQAYFISSLAAALSAVIIIIITLNSRTLSKTASDLLADVDVLLSVMSIDWDCMNIVRLTVPGWNQTPVYNAVYQHRV